jgi:hypothetical protein
MIEGNVAILRFFTTLETQNGVKACFKKQRKNMKNSFHVFYLGFVIL